MQSAHFALLTEISQLCICCRYVTAMYWSLSTMTTVGYGDVIPGSAKEKLVAMGCMVVGITVFAYFMGAMANLLAALNTVESR